MPQGSHELMGVRSGFKLCIPYRAVHRLILPCREGANFIPLCGETVTTETPPENLSDRQQTRDLAES